MAVMVEQIQHNDGSLHQLDDLTAIHVLRNPGGWTDEAVRSCRLFAANVLEDRARRANMLKPQRVRDALESRITNGPRRDRSMTDYADLEKRLRTEGIAEMDEAADAIASLTNALRAAHQAAVDRAMALDSEAESHSDADFRGMRKMQGAAAAVIANDILAILHAHGLSREGSD